MVSSILRLPLQRTGNPKPECGPNALCRSSSGMISLAIERLT